jgi:hypothetical protein
MLIVTRICLYCLMYCNLVNVWNIIYLLYCLVCTFAWAGRFSQLSPLSGFAVPARQATKDGHGSSLCGLAGRYGDSAERA